MRMFCKQRIIRKMKVFQYKTYQKLGKDPVRPKETPPCKRLS
jgi:hypothetical protein